MQDRRVWASDIVGVTEIAERFGFTLSAVSNWIHRDPTFPAPLRAMRRASVWNWPDIERWAKQKGKLD